ncbi:type II secretion system protein [Alkalihalobacillus deserti]|uniref:type II secretion system protein n=1 Tax=Alkalihalobacillus deserti TaxID=2879466 RepID=UPI0027E03488|nr:prepilin-type N-terminal cleavage/methylation domain-containing protein [Alkalihalobacillus deserti]
MKNQKRLTLIELLVVVVILGIIAAITITIPMVMSNQSEAEEAARERNEQIVQDAVNRFIITDDSVPSNKTDIGKTHLVPEYLSTWPGDDGYTVTVTADGIVKVE